MKSKHQKRVELFMRKAEQEIPSVPTMPSEEVRLLRARLIMEEAFETMDALGVRMYPVESPCADHSFDDFAFEASNEPNMIGIADGCADLSVVTIGTLSACGIQDKPVLFEVDESNLRKFDPGGHKREDGKWIKPPDWRAPDLEKVLKKQGWQA